MLTTDILSPSGVTSNAKNRSHVAIQESTSSQVNFGKSKHVSRVEIIAVCKRVASTIGHHESLALDTNVMEEERRKNEE
ncbi:hypothetical protein Lal_00008034 [Lupinus albus]|nr:hypothetical protein Lal_00008034 [Lupinus albus]